MDETKEEVKVEDRPGETAGTPEAVQAQPTGRKVAPQPKQKIDVMKAIEAEQMKDNAENFNVGDTVKVYFKIIEGATERVQVFEGLVLCKKNFGLRKTFTVRKLSYGVGVERIFPLHSPRIEKIEVTRRGRVRRAKLYYIRKKVGKKAKVKELIIRKEK